MVELASQLSPTEAANMSSDADRSKDKQDQINFDVNRRMAGYWDPQVAIKVLRWLKAQKVFDDSSLNTALKQILSTTMLIDAFPALTGEPAPEGFVAKVNAARAEFVQTDSQIRSFMACLIKIGHEKAESGPTSALDRKSIKEWNAYWQTRKLADEAIKNVGDLNPAEAEGLLATYQEFPENVLEIFLRHCQLFYMFGEYKMAKQFLLFYLDHVCEFTTEGRERTDLTMACLWGLMAAMSADLPDAKSPEVLQQEMQKAVAAAATAGTAEADGSQTELSRGDHVSADVSNPDAAASSDDTFRMAQHVLLADDLVDPIRLKEHNRQKILLERTWLVHRAIWPLMVYYFPKSVAATAANISSNPRSLIPNHLEWTRLIDWLFSDRIMNLICTVCPHLLRYIAVIAILNRQRQDHFECAVEAIARSTEHYSDPFTSILDSLFVKFDFEGAQEKLALSGAAAAADYLLSPLQVTLEENARLLIFQTYCRIQKSININVIAGKLHMTPETAERWIVNLIRQARLEAKIDSERNRVEIATQTLSVYQQVVDKTRNLVVRTNVLVQHLDRLVGSPMVVPSRTMGGVDFGAFRQRPQRGGGPGNSYAFGGR